MAKAQPIIVLFLCFVLFGLAFAQDDTPRPEPPQQQQQAPQSTQMDQPLYVSGKVVYDDGSPADMNVRVELLCDGRVRRQVHTLNGNFSLQVGGSTREFTSFDATVGSRDALGPVNPTRTGNFGGDPSVGPSGQGGQSPPLQTPAAFNLHGCELRANQAGFQSESISLAFRRPLDNPDVGVLVLFRAGSIAGTTTSVTTMSAPKKARKGYKKALKEMKRKSANYEKAVAELENATDLYPEFAEAWNLLGQIRLQLKNESGAQKAFESAAASDSKYLPPQLAMMELESRRQSWDQVSQWSNKVIELHPYLMKAHFYQGLANLHLNHLDQAEESLTKVRTSHKAEHYPYAGYLLGLVLADKGNFDGAAKELKDFLKLRPEAPEGDRVKTTLKDWEENGLIKGAEKKRAEKN